MENNSDSINVAVKKVKLIFRDPNNKMILFHFIIPSRLVLTIPHLKHMVIRKSSILSADPTIMDIFVDFSTTKETVLSYFHIKNGNKKITITYAIYCLADFLCDEDTCSKFNYKKAGIKTLEEFQLIDTDHVNKWCNEYIAEHFDNNNFTDKLKNFVKDFPVIAEYIFINVDRNVLIKRIDPPNRRKSRLLKIKFSEILEYVNTTSRNSNDSNDSEWIIRTNDGLYPVLDEIKGTSEFIRLSSGLATRIENAKSLLTDIYYERFEVE